VLERYFAEKGLMRTMNNRSFPSFILLLSIVATVGVPSANAQSKTLTAREVVARVQAHVGIPWMAETVDTFKAGNPDTEVKGIAVTMMATLDVLQRAAAAGQNLIITHEPTFYNHQDKPVELEQKENDPVLAAKRAFIAEHGLVILEISRSSASDESRSNRNRNRARARLGEISGFQQSVCVCASRN